MSPDPAIPGNSGHGARDARADYYYSDKIVNSTWPARAAYCAVVQVKYFVIFSTHFWVSPQERVGKRSNKFKVSDTIQLRMF